MEATATKFEQWALVEIYGHQKYAGLVTEQTIGGCNFVRVDVPETASNKPFTKLFGQGAIFSISPIEEDVARHLASRYDQQPVHVYELPRTRSIADHSDDDIDDSDSFGGDF